MRALVTALIACLLPAAAAQETFVLLDVSTAGSQGDADALDPRLSADGRYAAFESDADNLVPGIITVGHVFVRDRLTGTTTIESISTTGKKGNARSQRPDISGDGRFVVFDSLATNLVTPDLNGEIDVFLRDRQLGTTDLVSVAVAGGPGHGESRWASVSDDGRFVAFQSSAPDLVAGDGNGATDVFVRDRLAGTTTLVSVTPAGEPGVQGGFEPRIAADGHSVAFLSTGLDLVGLPGGAFPEVMLRDLLAGVTTLESVNAAGEAANSTCQAIGLSADASLLVFASGADNLVAGDTNLYMDVFVRDRTSALTLRVSVGPDDLQSDEDSGAQSHAMSLSGDGSRVAFESGADLLEPGSGGAYIAQVYVHDLATGLTTPISVPPAGDEPDGGSFGACLERSGQELAFHSGATNLSATDSNGRFFDTLVCAAPPLTWSWRGHALAGGSGFALLHAQGTLATGAPGALSLAGAAPSALALLFVSLSPTPVPFKGGTLVPVPFVLAVPLVSSVAGGLQLPFLGPAGVPAGTTFTIQTAIVDAGAPAGVALSNAIQGTTP